MVLLIYIERVLDRHRVFLGSEESLLYLNIIYVNTWKFIKLHITKGKILTF